ncbi:hypothetical protein Gogos_020748, partial [Gossypium gossypioides]|nr:hypothetical protein [Gossypium gossypioides]
MQSDEFPEQNFNQFEDDNSMKIIKNISPRTMMEEPKPNSAMETETECNGKSNGCQVRNGDKSTSHPIIQQFKPHVMTENPFFQVVMHPSYVGHSSDKKIAMFSTPLQLKRENLNCYLQAETNRGKAIYTKRIEISFIVVIQQGQHANCHQSLASTDAFRPEKWIAPSYASRSRTEPLTALEKTKAFRIASAFKSENPFFVVIIQPSNVKSCRLHSIEKLSVISGTGWRGFAMDNNLEVDDVCAFELIEGPKTSMK